MTYWIGDWVRNTKTGQTGRYEGTEKGMARLRFGKEITLVKEEWLNLVPESELEKLRADEAMLLVGQAIIAKPETASITPFEPVLDLHIEKLAPHLKGKQVELILHKQLKEARAFIVKAIQNRQIAVEIVHGKGTGALKMEIEHLAREFDEVYFTRPVHDGGGVELMFRYDHKGKGRKTTGES